MRLSTARDELEPLRDPLVQGPDDPRLTILVLARVVEKLGTIEYVSANEIEGLYAADLAFLQDFYGVINFGDQQEYEELLQAQASTSPPPEPIDPNTVRTVLHRNSSQEPVTPDVSAEAAPSCGSGLADGAGGMAEGGSRDVVVLGETPSVLPANPQSASTTRTSNRRNAIHEVSSTRDRPV